MNDRVEREAAAEVERLYEAALANARLKRRRRQELRWISLPLTAAKSAAAQLAATRPLKPAAKRRYARRYSTGRRNRTSIPGHVSLATIAVYEKTKKG